MAEQQFIALYGLIVGGDGASLETIYQFDGKFFGTRQEAIDHGFTLGRSDDFNIGVIKGGKLVRLDWMDMLVGASAARMQEISDQVGLLGKLENSKQQKK